MAALFICNCDVACFEYVIGYLKGMDKNPVGQPAWALESDDVVVQMLIRAGTKVSRANYIRLAFMGGQDENGELPAEYEADLPEPLRSWDQDGNRRDIRSL